MGSIIIKVDTPSAVDPYRGLKEAGCSQSMDAVCDAMVIGVLALKGTQRDHFINGHPGGIITETADDNPRGK